MRIVQIGVGGWGQNHIRVLSKLGVLVAICDSDAKKAAAFGGQYSVNHYTAFDDMINSEKFDGAFVVTPHTYPCCNNRKAFACRQARVCRKAHDI